MDNIFKYENWPYFFIAIIIFLIFVNAKKCHDTGRYLTQLGESTMTVVPVHGLNTVAAQAGAQAGVQTAAQIGAKAGAQAGAQTAALLAQQFAAQTSAQTARQVSEQVAAQTTANVLTEAFAKRPTVKPVKVVKAKKAVPKTFSEKFKPVKIFKTKKSVPNTFTEGFNSVRRVAQRENFATIDPYITKEGVNIGAAGCGCSSCTGSNGNNCGCTTCNENLNDQINLGVNNYLFPNCNNDFACMNGCNIQDQINNYHYDYYTGHSCTELERSRAGAYTSLNVDSCSQDCPSMNWLPAATATRDAAAEYITTLEPVESFKKKSRVVRH